MYSPFKMKGKSPMMKALVGKQNNLPAELKAKIEAAPESPAKMKKASPSKMKKKSSIAKNKGDMKKIKTLPAKPLPNSTTKREETYYKQNMKLKN